MNHIEQLALHIPNLLKRNMLDVGSGRGKFLDMARKHGAQVVGLEYDAQRASATGAIQGMGEAMPFNDGQFGFLNISEVLEHCQDPLKLLQESFRVLETNGFAYISIPCRYGLYDPHYHLPLINLLPRFIGDFVITLLGKNKGIGCGAQKLSEMHYMTYGQAHKMIKQAGFFFIDTRETKLPLFAIPFYRLVRNFYPNVMHFILRKP